jgi:hypothetical protein
MTSFAQHAELPALLTNRLRMGYLERELNSWWGKLTMKSTNLNQCRMTAFFIALVLMSSMLFQPRANGQDAVSLPDTLAYVKNMMSQHGRADLRFSVGTLPSNWVTYWMEVTSIDGCIVSTHLRAASSVSYAIPPVDRKDDLALFEPVVRDSPLDASSYWLNGTKKIRISRTDASAYLDLPIDSSENAAHLLNALSHAITLCGGKKAAF